MIKIYLAGNALFTTYREYTKTQFGNRLRLIDPIQENGAVVDVEAGTVQIDCPVNELIENDKAMIINCDIFVAFVEESTFGTTMEILHAYNNNIPVYIILGKDSHHRELDFWLSYHTTRFFLSDDILIDGIDKCFNYILENLKPNNNVTVYSRPECPFKYCDAPDVCKASDKCRHAH